MSDQHPETRSLPPDTEAPGAARKYHRQESDAHPEQIGPYKILKVLGEGGMGVVYLAEQTKPIHRRVALKIIKLGMDTKQVIARFETEREALALMNHPHVAKVFDAGRTEQGRPYFVMEYVEGEPVTAFCDRAALSTQDRLKLFMQVCQAIQHAHQKGIIHRDLKPSNVLVTRVDNQPAVKVIDFGIAKATQQQLSEATYFTEQGQLVGTPAYMSPEQADLTSVDIDTRTDIYSLGVLLYELLVGVRPFDDQLLRRAGLAEIHRIIREVDPPKPSTRLSALGSVPRVPTSGPVTPADGSVPRVPTSSPAPDESPRQPLLHSRGSDRGRGSVTDIAHQRGTDPKSLYRQIRGELDWIVMKCLEKDRTRRYETANGLALELQRYLDHEPVLAGPPSATYRVGKFVRRNRLAVLAAAVVALSLTGGLVGTSMMYVRAETQRGRAETALVSEAEQRRRAQDNEARAQENEVKAQHEAAAARKERDKAKITSEFMSDILKGAGPSVALGRDTMMLKEMLDGAAKRIRDGELKDAREAELQLRGTIGQTYQELGVFEQAHEMIQPTVEQARRLYGEEHPEVAASLKNLADVLDNQGNYSEAEQLYREALAMRRKLLGEEHLLVAQSLNNLARVLRSQGNYPEAEQLHRESLAMGRKLLGEEHQLVATSLDNLAGILESQGNYPEAERLFRQSLAMWRKLLGEEHPDVATSLNNLANVLERQGNYPEAERLHREALAMFRKLLGEEHPTVATSLANLALVLEKQGNYPEAELLLREALAMDRRLLGEEHPDVASSLNFLGSALLFQLKYAEAEPILRQAVAMDRQHFGALHPGVAGGLVNLGTVLLEQGNDAEAESLLRESLAIYRTVNGDDNEYVAECLDRLAAILDDRGDSAQAEELYRQALAIQRRILGVEHPVVGEELFRLGSTLEAQGKLSEAEESYRESIAILRKAVGAEHPNLAGGLIYLGAFLTKQNRFADADPLIREVLQIREKIYPADHWLVHNTRGVLGECLLGEGKMLEAVPLIVESGDWLRTHRESIPAPFRNKRLRDAAERAARLYDAWDAAEPGKGYDQKAAEWRGLLEATEENK